MGLRTPLYSTHKTAGAKIVDFGGWDMPLHYGSQIEEHTAVRRDAGMFDVSHMGVIDLHGSQTHHCLRRLLANDVGKLTRSGSALYSCMLLPSGGIIDDLIVYRMTDTTYRLVVNAGTRVKDLAWIRAEAQSCAVTVEERTDLALIAVQGPTAREKAAAILPAAARSDVLSMAPFNACETGSWFVARTGYTGEDGFEIMVPADAAERAWQDLAMQGVVPAGLGARDTLRLEAGMNLYGSDMDEAHHPIESGLAWTVAFDAGRDFIGRAALEGPELDRTRELVGLVLEERGVLRSHQTVHCSAGGAHTAMGVARDLADCPRIEATMGVVTSGTFSPTLNRAIALARVLRGWGSRLWVDIRAARHPARTVKPPFVRHGRSLIAFKET